MNRGLIFKRQGDGWDVIDPVHRTLGRVSILAGMGTFAPDKTCSLLTTSEIKEIHSFLSVTTCRSGSDVGSDVPGGGAA